MDLGRNLGMGDVVRGIGVLESLAQNRQVLRVLTALQLLKVFRVLNGHQSHDAFAMACEHDSLIAERDPVDVLGKFTTSLRDTYLDHG